MTMSDIHHDVTTKLSDYLDGELSVHEEAAVDHHLAGCAECRKVLAELRMVVATARQLTAGRVDADLWAGVEARIQGSSGRVSPFRRRPRRTFAFTLPQLAAAGIALMLMSGGMVYFAGAGRTLGPRTDVAAPNGERAISSVSLADPRYEDAVQDLERTLAEGRERLDPDTVRVLEQNLATIDKAIAQSREALEADPGNVFLNRHLVSARQRKLALLRRATALTTGS